MNSLGFFSWETGQESFQKKRIKHSLRINSAHCHILHPTQYHHLNTLLQSCLTEFQKYIFSPAKNLIKLIFRCGHETQVDQNYPFKQNVQILGTCAPAELQPVMTLFSRVRGQLVLPMPSLILVRVTSVILNMMQRVQCSRIPTDTVSQPYGFEMDYAYVQYYQYTSAGTDTPYFKGNTCRISVISVCLIFSKAVTTVDQQYSCFH